MFQYAKRIVLEKSKNGVEAFLMESNHSLELNLHQRLWRMRFGKYMAQGIGQGFNNTLPSIAQAMQEKLAKVTQSLSSDIAIGDIPQIQGNQIISENSYVTKNYTNTIETIRQPQSVELVLDGTTLARAIIQPLGEEYNRLGVKL